MPDWTTLTATVDGRRVNAALDDVAFTVGAWADADQLGAAMRDPEARAAARDYLARRQA